MQSDQRIVNAVRLDLPCHSGDQPPCPNDVQLLRGLLVSYLVELPHIILREGRLGAPLGMLSMPWAPMECGALDSPRLFRNILPSRRLPPRWWRSCPSSAAAPHNREVVDEDISWDSRPGQRDRDDPQSPELRPVGGLIEARARHPEALDPAVRSHHRHAYRSSPMSQTLAPATPVRGRECSSRWVLRRLLQGRH